MLSAQKTPVFKVQTGSKDFDFFKENNISPLHGFLKKTGEFTGVFDQENIQNIISSEISFDEYVKQKAATIHSCFGTIPDYVSPTGWQHGSMGGFYTYAEVLAELDTMFALFPNIITPKTQISNYISIESRPLHYLKISDNPQLQENEPQILFTAIHHSQEPASVQQLVYFMYYLLENYGSDPEITYFIDNTEIYFIPFVNPDGYVYNQTENPGGGGLWRKNRRNNGLSTGVDLNRNYAYAFGYDELGSSSIGWHVWYRGDSAFSEPETQAVKYFLENHQIKIALNWHAYGNMIIYPWNYQNYYTEDSLFFETLGKNISAKNHYRYGTVHETYGYQSNGDADDWGYGELMSKNKIMSFTGECGNMDDGFWPSFERIEPICKEALDMNLRLLRFTTKYAEVSDNSESIITNSNGYIPFKLQCLGVDTPANFIVTFIPLSGNISFPNSQQTFSNLSLMHFVNDSMEYNCNLSSDFYEEVRYIISVNNGNFTRYDTITRYTGLHQVLFDDYCENMNNWTGDDFGISSSYAISGTYSISESPTGNYSLLQSSEIICNEIINLDQTEKAFINFRARWNLEKNYDYVQLLASSDNGDTWSPLCGKYTTVGSDDEEEGQPVFDGIINEWIYEEVDISEYAGQNLLLKFYFYSDQSNTRDGFYFDDFKVTALYNPTAVNQLADSENNFNVYFNENKLSVVVNKKFNEPLFISIFNLLGQKINDVRIIENRTNLNFNNNSAGIYIYQIS
ncbi:MAG: hypothetical protein A2X01_08170 [Bacteroidetes bacterium GWF2_35_48]|nr:MAG: hypothetical protein A2X01_08170 [Bacteroidetes bacterium GWF2_35_48]